MKDFNEKNGKIIQICIMPNMALIGNQKISIGLSFLESKTDKEGRREGEEEEGKRRRRRRRRRGVQRRSKVWNHVYFWTLIGIYMVSKPRV